MLQQNVNKRMHDAYMALSKKDHYSLEKAVVWLRVMAVLESIYQSEDGGGGSRRVNTFLFY